MRLLNTTKDKTIISTLLKYDPEHPLLLFEGKDTDRYQTITKWCNIQTDLKNTIYDNILETYNGIPYSKSADAFIYLNLDDFENEEYFEYYLTEYINKLNNHEIMRPFIQKEISFKNEIIMISDDYFNLETIEYLENNKVLSKSLDFD